MRWILPRRAWRAAQGYIDPARRVFITESGVNTKMARACGRGPRCERVPGQGATGQTLPTVVVKTPRCLDWTITLKDRPRHKETRGHWHDRATAERTTETAPGGDGQAANTLRHSYPNKEQATWAAKARARDLQRAEASLSAVMIGDTTIMAGARAATQGLRPGADMAWTLKRAEHVLSSSGYTTHIEAEAAP